MALSMLAARADVFARTDLVVHAVPVRQVVASGGFDIGHIVSQFALTWLPVRGCAAA